MADDHKITRAVRCSEHGAIDVLDVVEVPRPAPCAGEALVEVKAARINARANQAAGLPLASVLLVRGDLSRDQEFGPAVMVACWRCRRICRRSSAWSEGR